MRIADLTAVQLSARIRRGELTAEEAVRAALDRIAAREKELHCYITIEEEQALARAEQVQRQIADGTLTGPLAGVPVAVKDNICTKGMRTTCGSRMLSDFVPFYDAQVMENLERAGAILLGKTNMDEFAMGSTTETSAYGVTVNPWKAGYVPGGSSGGSAAAVASGECFAALGSDTGGSARQPAAYCGLVGMKPTYGTVSRYGLVAYGSSLEQIAPLTKDVTDCAALLQVLASYDKKDATSVNRTDREWVRACIADVRGMKIGIPVNHFGPGLQPEVEQAVKRAAEVFKDKGAVVEEFELQLTEYMIPAYYVIAFAEAGSNLERFDGVAYGYRTQNYDTFHDMYKRTRSEGFGQEVKRRIMMGSFVLSSGYYDAYYNKAMKVRTLIRQTLERAFDKYDLLLGPVTPTTAPKLGESLGDFLHMYQSDIYTVAANLTGMPAVSVPCGLDQQGMPIGMQLMAGYFQEQKLFRAAYTYEQAGVRGKLPERQE